VCVCVCVCVCVFTYMHAKGDYKVARSRKCGSLAFSLNEWGGTCGTWKGRGSIRTLQNWLLCNSGRFIVLLHI